MIKFVMGVLLGMALIKFDVLQTVKEVFVDVGGADYVIENMEGLKSE